jgi:hypothetical protein
MVGNACEGSTPVSEIGVELDDGMSKILTCFYINVA